MRYTNPRLLVLHGMMQLRRSDVTRMHIACAVVMQLFQRGVKAQCCTVAVLVDEISSTTHQHSIATCCEPAPQRCQNPGGRGRKRKPVITHLAVVRQ